MNATSTDWGQLRQPPPRAVRDQHGVRRLIGRRWALFIGEQFFCPTGHRIRDTRLALDQHVFRCTFKWSRDARECGLLVYVVTGLKSPSDATDPAPLPRLSWALELDPTELHWMQQHGVRRLTDVQLYLGGFWFPSSGHE